ncbi:MAG TPA: FtsW/RodA/SpoVE family cell cycle protein [Patescibacteria group bacterium]|nr:FtsW/RodA/SpoVE family cell cycle protein [Patescibacteria group bacterium]
MFIRKLNLPLLILPILLFSIGYITLRSTHKELAENQLVYFIIGYLLYILISAAPSELFFKYWKAFYFPTFVILTITLLLGIEKYGSSSWIKIGTFVIQPSEFAKISLIISLSALICSNAKNINSARKMLNVSLMSLLIVILVLIQPDLGSALVLFVVVIGLLFYAGLSKYFFVGAFIVLGLLSSPFWSLLQDYQKKRVLVFLNPSLDILGAGYNVTQSLIAIGSGGFMGKGFEMGTQSHLGFLPVFWTDFIYASFAEEWGFIGIVIFNLIYMFFLIYILYLSKKANTTFKSLLIIGVFFVFMFQYTVNVGMNLGMLPVTGITLPFVSYGGSSLFSSLILLGLVQSMCKE